MDFYRGGSAQNSRSTNTCTYLSITNAFKFQKANDWHELQTQSQKNRSNVIYCVPQRKILRECAFNLHRSQFFQANSCFLGLLGAVG